jgi:Raf kinase inhibitor-like YbhB/YbcL family protein
MPLTLRTPAFANGKPIPKKYTRDGENLSPPLAWSGAPAGTRSFVLIVEDPDAPHGTFYHWAMFNIPGDRDGLAEGAGKPSLAKSGDGASAPALGLNDFGNLGYDGPEPPHGHGVHHDHFRLAALDVPSLRLPQRVEVAAVWAEATKHALATAEVVGTYER